jgi:hypothetical protein
MWRAIPEPEAAVAGRGGTFGGTGLVEALADVGEELLRDAAAGVADLDPDVAIVLGQ